MFLICNLKCIVSGIIMKQHIIVLFLMMIVSGLFAYSPDLTIDEAQLNLQRRINSFNRLNFNDKIMVSFVNEVAVLRFKNKELQVFLTEEDDLFVYHAGMLDFQDFVKERID